MENSDQRGENGMALLVHGRKITADAAKSRGARGTAKGASNLLLHFGHAKIAFRQIVGKRNTQVIEQRQHLIGPQEQSIKQILGRTVFASAFAFVGRSRQGRGLSRIPSSQDLKIASDPLVPLDGGHRRQAELTPLLRGVVQIEQELSHLAGPRLVFLLSHGGTITQPMRSTETMRTVIGLIA